MGVARAAPKLPHLGPLCANPGPPRSARLPASAPVSYTAGVAAGAAVIAARSTDEAPLVASCKVLEDTLI